MKRRGIKNFVASIQSKVNRKIKNISSASKEERVPYDECTNNGLIFNDEHYIPEELLSSIMAHYVDFETLRSCQLVCKQWNLLAKNYVWRKKTELILNHPLPLNEDIPWTTYYSICRKRPFNRNLVKNHSGQKIFTHSALEKSRIPNSTVGACSRKTHYLIAQGPNCDWAIISGGWSVEEPPVGVPALPDDPVFDGKNCCFVTTCSQCLKEQVIDLVEEGISEYILDHGQPTIRVSEWFSSRSDCGAVYACTTKLTTENGVVLSHFNYSKKMVNEEQNQWFKFEHEFKNYGKGLRKIKFSHGGQDLRGWAGHYGSKMAGACITLDVPNSIPRESPAPQEQPTSPEPYYWYRIRPGCVLIQTRNPESD